MLKSKHQYSDSSFGKSVRIAHSARVPLPKRANARAEGSSPNRTYEQILCRRAIESMGPMS